MAKFSETDPDLAAYLSQSDKTLEGFIEPFLEAESGDWRAFANMIEKGEPLSPAARKMIAEHLRGSSAPPKRRKRAQERVEVAIGSKVADKIKSGLSKYAAMKAVADETGANEETIKTYLRNLKREWEKIDNKQ